MSGMIVSCQPGIVDAEKIGSCDAGTCTENNDTGSDRGHTHIAFNSNSYSFLEYRPRR